MTKCPVCGAEMDDKCKFEVSQQSAPWLNDYNLMASGKMTHGTHQILVARWNLHHREQVSDKVYQWSLDTITKYAPDQ